MCGRYTSYHELDALAELLGIMKSDSALLERSKSARYNIAPSQLVIAALDEGEGRHGGMFRWGLIPSGARDENVGHKMINARSETAFEKPSFRVAMRKRRCAIPASGYYEWRIGKGSRKQAFYFRDRRNEPLAFAGIWEKWQRSSDEAPILSCSILTTQANTAVSEIHDRMPVLLSPATIRDWLDPSAEKSHLAWLMASRDHPDLEMCRVSSEVNRPANDHEGLIIPVEGEETEDDDPQLGLL